MTRSDIARFLKVGPKQAGRLMTTMSTILVGHSQRRVMRSDFDAWLAARREVLAEARSIAKVKHPRARTSIRLPPRDPELVPSVVLAARRVVEARRVARKRDA